MVAGSSYRELALDLKSGDILAALAETAPLHPRDVVHVFKTAVLAATGAELGDDAAVLCLDWRGSTRQGAL